MCTYGKTGLAIQNSVLVQMNVILSEVETNDDSYE